MKQSKETRLIKRSRSMEIELPSLWMLSPRVSSRTWLKNLRVKTENKWKQTERESE